MTTRNGTSSSQDLLLLNQIANRQAVLSTTADRLRRRLDLVRHVCFALAIVGATLAAIASGLTSENFRAYLIWPATGMLALGTFLGSRLLGQDSVTMHVKARLASESLKREAYLYATESADYREPSTRDHRLFGVLTTIDSRVVSFAREEQESTSTGSCPRRFLSSGQYVSERIVKQIEYYRNRAERLGRSSRMLHGLEFVLAAAAAVVTGVAAVSNKGGFDVAALTAVVTTLTGIIMAHLYAGRYDDQTSTYRITANRLEAFKATITPTTSVADVAEKVEEIIACETESWQTLWLDKS